jgi:hypothetical protein
MEIKKWQTIRIYTIYGLFLKSKEPTTYSYNNQIIF